MNLPDKQLLRRGEVVAFLGCSQEAFSALVASGTLKPFHVSNRRRAFFTRDAVLALVRPGNGANDGKPLTKD